MARVSEVVVELLRRAETDLPKDVEGALVKAYGREKGTARTILKSMVENTKTARKNRTPMCQDTGLPIFFVSAPDNVNALDMELEIKIGVLKATREIPLRPNVVHPLTRENTGINVGVDVPIIHYGTWDKNYIEITALPKGAGSENMSALRMLKPSEGAEGIKKFVLETVAGAGGQPCPPTVIGLGIGGSSDRAMLLAKKALLRPVDKSSKDVKIAGLEGQLLKDINKLGVGPMGLGGRTTCLGVNIEQAHCHTASLPVAINVQCWAARRATVRIRRNRIEWPRS